MTCTLAVKVLPNAPRNMLVGRLENEVLKVKIRAVALEGRANDELREFISEVLGLPKRSVEIVHGEKSRQKLLRISELDFAELKIRLERKLGAPAKSSP